MSSIKYWPRRLKTWDWMNCTELDDAYWVLRCFHSTPARKNGAKVCESDVHEIAYLRDVCVCLRRLFSTGRDSHIYIYNIQVYTVYILYTLDLWYNTYASWMDASSSVGCVGCEIWMWHRWAARVGEYLEIILELVEHRPGFILQSQVRTCWFAVDWFKPRLLEGSE